MAGNEDAQRVAAHCGSDPLRGRVAADSCRELAVGHGLAVRDLLEVRPHQALEIVAVRDERQVELAARSAQVLGELGGGLVEAVLCLRSAARLVRHVPVAREVQALDAVGIAHQGQLAER